MISLHVLRYTVQALLVISLFATFSQAQTEPTPTATPDVIRTETNLVQTGITVVDKKGNFVEGLRLENFELRIDGKVQPISFLTQLTAGTNSETTALNGRKEASTPNLPDDANEQGRIVIFFIDDLHLSARSVQQTRQTILNFITNQMGPLDLVAIASASGQIGFLQQFTDHKGVLRAAVNRLNHRPYTIHDTEAIAMTEYHALRVEQGDRDALTYFTNQLLLANNFNSPGGALGPPAGGPMGQRPSTQPRSSGLSREMAERMVKERALMMLKQSEAVTANTLMGLESLIRTSSKFTGRKLLFFMSDGFYLNDKNTGFAGKLHELTDAAIRAGVVVYSLDTRGLIATIDVASNRSDPEGKLSRANTGELTASQDPLNALAENTGGRALFDSDGFAERVGEVIKESANYYLLSWRPETPEQKTAGFKRIEITVAGRPELTVRRPKGYLVAASSNSNVAQTDIPKSVDADLKTALTAANAIGNIPIVVSPSFVDSPDNGLLLTASVQAGSTGLSYGTGGKASADLAGVVLNDQGKAAASFRTRLTVNALPPEMDQGEAGVVYNYKAKLSPGLYQIRTAVRDELSGKVGSASEWIEIPDLTKSRLTLSTLLLRRQSPAATQTKSTNDLPFSVDRRFSKSSQLGFFLFIYNASKVPGSPDLTAQVEVFRHGRSVVATPVRKLSMEGMTDLARIPYAGQFPLASLPNGRYELLVTISDRVAHTTATERVTFKVE